MLSDNFSREDPCLAGDKTRNMEHFGTSRNIPEYSGGLIYFHEKDVKTA